MAQPTTAPAFSTSALMHCAGEACHLKPRAHPLHPRHHHHDHHRRRHCNHNHSPHQNHPSRRRRRPRQRAVSPTAVVILGGSSGVGLEAANHLHANGRHPTTFSRRTGHDLRDPAVARSVLRDARAGVAVSVGAGRRASSRDDELALYASVIAALAAAAADDPQAVGLVVAVARTLILPDVRRMLQQHQGAAAAEGGGGGGDGGGVAGAGGGEQQQQRRSGAGEKAPASGAGLDWVIVRPGPLVDLDPRRRRLSLGAESLLVTADPRCNGLVSRRAAGAVVAGLLLGRVPREQVVGTTLGVYDRNRMQSLPKGVVEVGSNALWSAVEP